MNRDHQRLLPEYHLRRPIDFRCVYDRRCSSADHRLLVFGRENGLSHCRLGLSISRKVGGAVVRNRWKRLLRESFRLSRSQLPTGIDLIIIPRPGIDPDLAGLMESLPRLVHRVASKLVRFSSHSPSVEVRR